MVIIKAEPFGGSVLLVLRNTPLLLEIVSLYMKSFTDRHASGPVEALVGPLTGESVGYSALQSRLGHLWCAAKLVAPTHAKLAQSYVYVV